MSGMQNRHQCKKLRLSKLSHLPLSRWLPSNSKHRVYIFRLKKVGLLEQGDENNPDAVAGAKESFKKRYGYSVDDKGIQ